VFVPPTDRGLEEQRSHKKDPHDDRLG
jgi:hypothetical protein